MKRHAEAAFLRMAAGGELLFTKGGIMTSTAAFKAPGVAGPLIHIPMAAPGGKAVVAARAGHDLYFAFFPATAASARAGSDLVFAVDGGGAVVVKDFFAVYRNSFPYLLLPGGMAVASEDFFADSPFAPGTAVGFGGWDNAVPFYTGNMDCVMDDAMPDCDIFGLNANAVAAAGFPLEGFLDMEDDVPTLVTGRDGEILTQAPGIRYTGDMRPGAGGGFQPFAAMGAGPAAMPGDGGLRSGP